MTDYTRWFVDGATFHSREGERTVRTVSMGELAVPGGRLAICDPFSGGGAVVADAATRCEPELAVVDDRNALLRVRFGDAAATYWDEIGAFGVDSGMVAVLCDDHLASLEDAEWETVRQELDAFDRRHIREIGGRSVLVIEAGWGDGSYRCFLGHDADGDPVEVVVDFDVIRPIDPDGLAS